MKTVIWYLAYYIVEAPLDLIGQHSRSDDVRRWMEDRLLPPDDDPR